MLAAPSNLLAKALSGRQIRLSWVDNTSAEMAFPIERSSDGVNWTEIASVGPNVTRFTDRALVRRHKYYYRVRAMDAYMLPPTYSAYSNGAAATAKQ